MKRREYQDIRNFDFIDFNHQDYHFFLKKKTPNIVLISQYINCFNQPFPIFNIVTKSIPFFLLCYAQCIQLH